ncbi:MAG TPA: cytochrome-c oxidase, cbb3-type subunit III [Rubrivivax sp.]|nr:cytochrome-c oxidase, cbb3-type subunit III [Pseudomonadota bacterium]HRY86692.1 cytochrome-c oxidase, cbb3-type subunit III [Rubrivivax sp.]HRZ61791.1 cytochrome-c oxidase, cbb3-type subunit III [Rubrivivax sp.]
MSEMFSYGWSIFVAVVTTVSLAWCLWLLLVASKRREMAKDNTTGHVWDVDLRELNNPLPRWWFWLFVITVVFGAFYLVLYPGLGAFPGTLGWTSSGQYQTEQRRAQEAMAPLYAKLAATPFEQLAKDPQAMAIGERLFGNNCAGCHGANARGSTGFPNLTDGDWLYGGAPQTIIETITKGRTGTMPPMGEAVGTSDDVRNVAQYVLSLSGAPHDSARAQLGKPKFVVCAACHGPDGKGNPALGAPNLTDNVWLHGFGEAAIVRMVMQGKTSIMPPFEGRLNPEQIHVLAAYVWSLSQKTVAAAN